MRFLSEQKISNFDKRKANCKTKYEKTVGSNNKN